MASDTTKTLNRREKLQRHRLQMTLMSVANTLLQTGVLALFSLNGAVPWSIPLQFLLVGAGSSMFFALVIARGWNLRFSDQGLLLPQIAMSVTVQLAFLVLVPELWILFVFAVFVTYNFAMMSFATRQFTWAWLIVSGATGGALFLARGRFGNLVSSDTSLAVLWIFLFLCIRQLTAIGRQFSGLRSQLSAKNEQLTASLERIQELADKDDLTGCLNRRSFVQMLSDEAARTSPTDQALGIALLDIDHFKSVNDHHGHVVGDAVLREFCKVASSQLRSGDRFARWGGEEFVILFTELASIESTKQGAERIREAIDNHDWSTVAAGLRVTMSAGVAQFHHGHSITDAIDRADRALYKAKNSGRNRVVVDEEVREAAAGRNPVIAPC
jgi:diguanylate cyclase (GGDEF)-like protein